MLDSPIRNAINRASYQRKTESIKTLGPVCVMLKILIALAQERRKAESEATSPSAKVDDSV